MTYPEWQGSRPGPRKIARYDMADTTTSSWTLDATHPLGKRTIRRYIWPSGLRVLLLADHSAPIFSYQTWLRVGSRHERPGQTGMAHFFEHLMFNETTNLPRGMLDHMIEEVGGDNNAATWTDWTFYRTSLPANQLEMAVRIEADRMQNLILEADPIESEREVIINERLERVDNDVDGFLDERLSALAFRQHPYRWPTIGWMDDIRTLDQAAIQEFYRTYYVPSNATIIVVGDIDEERVLTLIDEHYGDIESRPPPDETRIVEPAQEREIRASYTKPVQAERLIMGYRAPGQEHPDWPVLDFIGELLTGGPSARLHRRLVIETEMVTSVDCVVMPFRDPNLFRIAANMTRDIGTDRVVKEIDAVLGELARTPIAADELARVRNSIETDFWAAMADCDGRAEVLGHYETTLGDFRKLSRKAAGPQ